MRARDAELLRDVTPGSSMHLAFKNYWMPVMRSDKLEADGAPVKFTILCEDYVAFRATDGRVAVFDELCPHRLCSLELAQNEDCSLTCLFHGWKFHVSGKCIETPNEPNPDFPAKVPLKSYPVREAAGVLWAYFGDNEPPRFSDLIFNRVPDYQVLARVAICNYSWLTGLEAILDPSHVGLMHRNWVEEAPNEGYSVDVAKMAQALAPTIECSPTDWGFQYAACRTLPDGSRYVRVTEHVAPSGCFIANSSSTRKLFIMSVPINSEWSNQWYFWHSPDESLPEVDIKYAIGGTHPDHSDMYQGYRGKPYWGQDREAMKNRTSFSGLDDIQVEDFVAGEAQGVNSDRSKEHLCTGDKAIIFSRRLMLEMLSQSSEGDREVFSHKGDFDYGALQAIATKLDEGEEWREVAKKRMENRAARLKTNEATG
jgi:phthalate 4,5-dioxygenase oxygenase subunit